MGLMTKNMNLLLRHKDLKKYTNSSPLHPNILIAPRLPQSIIISLSSSCVRNTSWSMCILYKISNPNVVYSMRESDGIS